MKHGYRLFCSGMLLLMGCVSGHDNAAAGDERGACANRGGDWRRVCIAQEYRCVMPYRDAGKACSDSSQCDGECLVDLTTKCTESGKCVDPVVPKPGDKVMGSCQIDDDPCGSFVIVRDGRAQPITHRD